MLNKIVTGVGPIFKANISRAAILFVCLFILTNSIHVQSSETAETVIDEKLRKQSLRIAQNKDACNVSQEIEPHRHDNTTRPMCPRAFDSILCWEATPANSTSRQKCPDYVIGFINPEAYAERICQPNGKWATKLNKHFVEIDYTNYSHCLEQDADAKTLAFHIPKVKFISKIGSGVSLTSLVLAILILSGLKRLHCARNILHINLFASFLLFSIMQLIKEFLWVSSLGFSKDVLPADGERFVMNENVSHWECKIFMSIYKYAEATEHAMIFSEALYLNTLVSLSTFNEKNHYKFYITLGWLAPLGWLIPYIAVLLFISDFYNSCWTEQTVYSFIQVVPQCFLILANFGLFVNIVRILFIKLKNGQTDSREYRYKKLAKSTLILLPLFGIYYIMFNVWQPFVIGKLSVELELARLYFDIVCNSFQGLIISLIYVFFNSEVRNEIIKIIERVLLRRNPNMRRFSKFSMPPNRERSISLNGRNAVARSSNPKIEKKNKQSLTSNKSSISKKGRNHFDSLKTQEASSMCPSEANSMYQVEEGKSKTEDYPNGKSNNNSISNNHSNGFDYTNKLLMKKSRKSSSKKFSFFNFFRRFKAEPETTNHIKSNSQTVLTRPTLRVDSIDVHEIKLKTKRNSKRVKLRPPSESSENAMIQNGEVNNDSNNRNAKDTAAPVVKIVVNGELPNGENESVIDSAFDENSNLLQTSEDNGVDYLADDDQEHPLFLKHLKLKMSSLDYIDETSKYMDRQESFKSNGLSTDSKSPSWKTDEESKPLRDHSHPAANGDLKTGV